MWRPSLVVEAVSRMSPRRSATSTFSSSIFPYSWRVSGVGLRMKSARVAIEQDVIAAGQFAANVVEPDDGGDIHRSGHDRGMGSLASLFGGKAKDERAVDGRGVGRGEVPRDDDVRFVFGGDGARRLPEEVPDHAARDVLDIHDALAKVGIVDGSERAAILLRHLVEGVFDIVTLVFEIAEDLVDQRAVFDDEKMRVKDAGILGADRVRDTLLDFKKLGASGDESGLETRDLLGKFLRGDRAKGDFLVVQPVDNDLEHGRCPALQELPENEFPACFGHHFHSRRKA